LLSAIDLPCEARAWALQLKQAASICPGATIDAAAINSRRVALRKARALVDAMLAELDSAGIGADPAPLAAAACAALELLDSYGRDDEQDDDGFVAVRTRLRQALGAEGAAHG
jgi:hypothetical protein